MSASKQSDIICNPEAIKIEEKTERRKLRVVSIVFLFFPRIGT